MKTVVQLLGENWQTQDVTVLDGLQQRRELGLWENHTEGVTFGMAYNALVRSMCRTDGHTHLQNYAEARYQRLHPGMFTMLDMARTFVEWKLAKRYIYGFGAGCGALMTEFFAPFLDGEVEACAARILPPDIPQIFAAILDAVQAAERLPVHSHVGSFNHLLMDQLLQNIGNLARAGHQITSQIPMEVR